MRSLVTLADLTADSADAVAIGAIPALGFFIGLVTVVIIAIMIKGRRGPKRRKVMFADQPSFGETGKGTSPSKTFSACKRLT